MEEVAVVPRVLMVQPGSCPVGADLEAADLEGAESVIAGDGETALEMLRRERFDAVIIDLGLAPLDGWCVLATVGNWVERPRLVAIVPSGDRAPEHVGRALILGADLCMAAGTLLDARALRRSTKERECPQPPTISFRRPTPSGVSA